MNNLKQEKGYIVLITVLILGVAATTIALFMLITGTDASLVSSAVEAGAQARAGADACANLALESIQQNPNLVAPANASATLDPVTQTECKYEIEGGSPRYRILATATVRKDTDNVIERASIELDEVSPKLHVTSWQESQ